MSTSPDTSSHLRRFAFVVATGLTVIGGLSWWRGHTTVPKVFWVVAAVLAVAGLVAPRALGPVERVWMRIGGVLAWVNTRIVLTILFYVVVTPVAVVMRMFRDPLDRRLDRSASTYWLRKPASDVRGIASYERQF